MLRSSFYEYSLAGALRVFGEDAPEFLQSQFSNDLGGLEAGQLAYGLWLDVKGKVVADSWVLRDGPEDFRLFSEDCAGGLIREKLERHIIADDVEIEASGEREALRLIGEDLEAVAGQLGVPVPGPGRFAVSAGQGASLFRGRCARAPSMELVFVSGEARDAFKASLAGICELERLSESLAQLERIRAGVPLVPRELGPADLPGEGGLVPAAVSLTKGCFLGQEVVARMHHVGRAQRGLFVVSGAGALPEVPSELLSPEGRRAGELRSAYRGDSGWTGVALLKLRAVKPGDELRSFDEPARIAGPLAAESSKH
ncbi:MAG: YgfZ/GcvT domain-containing protein [Opitutales bacterium]